MAYNLVISDHAEELIDHLVEYLYENLNNRQAAIRLLDGIDAIYDRLTNNPFQFSLCKDTYLSFRGYREAFVPQMSYRIIFRIEDENVIIVGVFHNLEAYEKKTGLSPVQEKKNKKLRFCRQKQFRSATES